MRREVAYGLVRYKDGSLRGENTDRLRTELLAVVAELRAALLDEDVPRSHSQAAYRCRACSMEHACDERLN